MKELKCFYLQNIYLKYLLLFGYILMKIYKNKESYIISMMMDNRFPNLNINEFL